MKYCTAFLTAVAVAAEPLTVNRKLLPIIQEPRRKKTMAHSFYQRHLTLIIIFLVLFLPVMSYGVTPQVAAGNSHTVGLRNDGNVVAAGHNNYGQCNVSGWGWTDIVQLAAGGSDGTSIGLLESSKLFLLGQPIFQWTSPNMAFLNNP